MIEGLPPTDQALYGTLFTWFVTAAGAAVVFVEPLLPGSASAHQLFLDTMLGFAGGVMIAASYWSLLAPGLTALCPRYPTYPWPPLIPTPAPLSAAAISMAEQDWYGKTKFAQIDLSNGIHKEVTYAWLPAAVGFAAGGLFLIVGDYVSPPPPCPLHPASPDRSFFRGCFCTLYSSSDGSFRPRGTPRPPRQKRQTARAVSARRIASS